MKPVPAVTTGNGFQQPCQERCLTSVVSTGSVSRDLAFMFTFTHFLDDLVDEGRNVVRIA